MGTLDEWARRQLGLVTSRQLTLLGWSEKQISRAIKTGELFPVRRGVFRLPGVVLTRELMWTAAVLAAGRATFVSHVTGAEQWGFRGFESQRIDLIRHGEQPIRTDGVRGHRTVWLPDRDVTVCRRLPITSPSRTLIDAASSVPFDVLNRALSDGLRRKVLSKPRLLRTFEVMPQHARRANMPMRELLAKWIPGYDPRSSDREQDVMDILAAAGVPLPVQQHGVSVDGITYHLDFSYPPILEAAEYEGFDDHGLDFANFHYDRKRTRRLVRLGWRISPMASQTSDEELIELFGAMARRAGLW